MCHMCHDQTHELGMGENVNYGYLVGIPAPRFSTTHTHTSVKIDM